LPAQDPDILLQLQGTLAGVICASRMGPSIFYFTVP